MNRPRIILLVPDLVVRRILLGMLRAAGYHVLPLVCVSDACKALMHFPVDLVLVDGELLSPATTRFLSELRAHYPGTARLLLVDEQHQAAGLDALGSGAVQAIVSKLVGSVELLETVSRLVECVAPRNADGDRYASPAEGAAHGRRR